MGVFIGLDVSLSKTAVKGNRPGGQFLTRLAASTLPSPVEKCQPGPATKAGSYELSLVESTPLVPPGR